jgi:hypothetical protein
MTRYLAIAGLATVALFAITGPLGAGGRFFGCITGSNDRRTDTRTVGSFTGIRLDGSVDVVLTEGPFAVTVEGDDNLVELVRTTLDGGDLVISNEKCYTSQKPIIVHVTLPRLERVAVNGSGDVRSTSRFASDALSITTNGSGDIALDVVTGELKSESNGSGNIVLKGRATTHRVTLNGSGDLNTLELASARVFYRSNGSGDGEVAVGDEVHARLAGSGDLVYHGSPTIEDTDAPGSGEIRRIP